MPQCKSCGEEARVLRGGRCRTCHELFLKTKSGDIDAEAALAQREGRAPTDLETEGTLAQRAAGLMVTTEMTVPNVRERLGVVTGQCALGMNIFRDFTAEIRDIVGGRSAAYQKAIKEAKDECISEMKIEAFERGADAVIAMDLDFNEITGGGGLFGGKGMIMVVATGTAVKLDNFMEEDDNSKTMS